MTTAFDSFDASALGEFVESPLGERNESAREAPEIGALIYPFGNSFDESVIFLQQLYLNELNTVVISPERGDWEAHKPTIELLFIEGFRSDGQYEAHLGATQQLIAELPALRRVVMIGYSNNIYATIGYTSELTGITPQLRTSRPPFGQVPMLPHPLTDGQAVYQSSFGYLPLAGGQALATFPAGHPDAGQPFMAVRDMYVVIAAPQAGHEQLFLNFWNV